VPHGVPVESALTEHKGMRLEKIVLALPDQEAFRKSFLIARLTSLVLNPQGPWAPA